MDKNDQTILLSVLVQWAAISSAYFFAPYGAYILIVLVVLTLGIFVIMNISREIGLLPQFKSNSELSTTYNMLTIIVNVNNMIITAILAVELNMIILAVMYGYLTFIRSVTSVWRMLQKG